MDRHAGACQKGTLSGVSAGLFRPLLPVRVRCTCTRGHGVNRQFESVSGENEGGLQGVGVDKRDPQLSCFCAFDMLFLYLTCFFPFFFTSNQPLKFSLSVTSSRNSSWTPLLPSCRTTLCSIESLCCLHCLGVEYHIFYFCNLSA